MKIDFAALKEKKSTEELLKFSILNVDKPTGPTSFDTSNFVRKIAQVNKTSHFGTLDPQVTGVLPVALSRACRLSNFFMHSDKEYVGIMRVHEEIPQEKLKEAMEEFKGKIMQLPPVRSRVKRALREREVKRFDILEINGKDVLFIADVQAGTYIRKLISDLGEKIGGAHMLELRRTRASVFLEKDSINLYDLEKAFTEYKNGDDKKLRSILIPAEFALSQVMPIIQVKESLVKSLLTGKPLTKDDLKEDISEEDHVALFFKDQLLQVVHPVKEGEIIARSDFVFN